MLQNKASHCLSHYFAISVQENINVQNRSLYAS